MNKLKIILDKLLFPLLCLSFSGLSVSYVEKANVIVEPFTNIEQMKILVFLASLLYILFADKVLAPFVIHIYDFIKSKIIKKRLEKNVDKYIERKFE